jgi:methionyl-tRNA formyltransferase
MKKKVKIVFMGTASFAVPSLKLLLRSGYEIAAVVTAPDKPAGRGKILSASPIKYVALENKLYLLQPDNLKEDDFINELRNLKPDLQIVVAFRMLPKSVWEIPALGTFNLHSSLLPQYRGAAPINHAIINGETQTGVTTFFIDEKIDTGRIILQDKTMIEPTESAGELHDKLMEMGARLVLKTVEAILSKTIDLKEQDELIPPMDVLKVAPKIFKEDCKISWDRPVMEVYNFIRGMSPVPCAFCFLKMKNGKTLNLKIYSTDIHSSNHDYKPGSFSCDGKNNFFIYCKSGALELKEVQLEGKKRMSTRDFLKGFKTEEILNII